MPSETMKARGLSPSFFHEEASFPDEGQNGARKPDHMPGYYGFKTGGTMRTEGVASSALENRVPPDSNIANGFDLRNFYLSGARNVNHSSGKHFVGAERAASRSLSSADHDLGARMNLNTDSTSYCLDGNKINLMGAQYENSLFSSSLSDLFSRKLTFPSNNAVYGHSVGAPVGAPHFEDEDTFESLEELEAQTIGNLLPDDDDLLSGVTDGFSSGVRLKNGDDNEDLDLFSNVGGLELGEDGSSLRNSEFADINGYNQFGLSELHPSVKHPSRTLFVRNINSNVDDSELRALFEQYGDIHVLYTACKHRGFVMISYYDLRAACNAMKALQSKSLRRRKLDIHFSIPKENPAEKDINQGTVVVFNHDASVSNDDLREIFGVYGEIKEVYETPNRIHHKFVEFYDVRAAESALRALNRSDISGKQIKLEPGQSSVSKSASMSDMYRLMQPYSSELEKEVSGLLLRRQSANSLATGFPGPLSLGGTTPNTDNGNFLSPHSNGGPITPLMDNGRHPGVSSSLSNSLSPLMRIDHQGIPSPHPHSLPEYHDSLANWTSFGSPSTISARPPEMIDNQQFRRLSSNGQSAEFNEVFGSSGNGSCPPPGRQYIWNNTHHSQSQALAWPNSPTFANGMSPGHRQLHGVPRAPSHMLNSVLPINNHHVGSAPSVNPSLWDRRRAYVGESPDANVFHPGSLGNMRVSGNSPHPLDFVPHNIFSQAGGNSPHHQRCMVFPPRGQVIPMMSSFESPNERTRNRRNEGGSGQGENKKQFELDVDRILRGDDKRTTLMIKNIPNKYTSKMLLSAIDEQHRGTYDFIYLPIDFKNKCNVGYAFINMIDPSLIVPFYQTLNGKKWEKFNSEKVASLAYARIQGKAALIAHFQNSSLMNEDKRCRPILFHTDGPNAGDQVPFPMGSNIRPRPSKVRASSTEENSQEMLPNSLKGEDYFNGDSSSGSGKDSD